MFQYIIPLWYRDWIWHLNHRKQTLIQLLIPLMTSLFGVFMFSLSVRNSEAPMTMSSIISHEENIYTKIPFPWKVQVFAKNVTAVKKLSSSVSQFTVKHFSHLNKAELEKLEGIVILDKWDVENAQLQYRIMDFHWAFGRHLAPIWGLWSLDQIGPERSIGDEFAYRAQAVIDRIFLQEISVANKTIKETMYHRAIPLFNQQVSRYYTILGQASTFVCIVTILQLIKQHQQERDSGMKKFLRVLNIGLFEYTLSYFLIYFLKFLIVQWIFWLPFIVYNHGLIRVAIILPGTIFHACNLSSFSLLASCLLRTRRMSVIGTIGILFVTQLGQMRNSEMLASPPYSFLSSTVFTSAYYYYLRASSNHIMTGGFVSSERMRPLMAVPFLIMDCIAMLVSVLYLETIYPGPKEKGKESLFFLRASYWLPYRKIVQQSVDENINEETRLKSLSMAASQININSAGLDTLPSNPSFHGTEMLDGLKKKTRAMKDSAFEMKGINLKGNECKPSAILSNIHFRVLKEEIFALYGPRGCGSKEILELIAGLTVQTSGVVEFSDIEKKEQEIIFDSGCCFPPTLTVLQVCEWVAKIRRADVDVIEMLDELEMIPLITKMPEQLKSHQRQLLNLLIAFIGNSNIILLDEPFKECVANVRALMNSFILKRKENRTIVWTTFDPIEIEEIADSVAFISNGYLSNYGSVSSLKQRYSPFLQMRIWPSATYDASKFNLIKERIKNALHLMKNDNIIIKTTPNECIICHIPLNITFSYQCLIDALTSGEDLGVSDCEFVTSSIQNAYEACLQSRDILSSRQEVVWKPDCTNIPELVESFKTLYSEPRKKIFWPELHFILSMKVAYLTRKWMLNLLATITPILAVTLIAYSYKYYILTADSVNINRYMLEKGNVFDGAFITNTNLYNISPQKHVKVINVTDESIFQDASWIFNNPPYILGHVEGENLTHIYSHGLIRFSNILANNIYSNTILKQNTDKTNGYIRTFLESLYTKQWRNLITRLKPGRGILNGLHSQTLSIIIAENWFVMMIVGVTVVMLTAQVALFISHLHADNCLKMHYLMGARPFMYWAALAFVDLLKFVILLTISLFVFIRPIIGNSATLFAFLSSVGAYLSTVPFVYWLSLRSRNVLTTYIFFLLYVGTIVLLPAFFSLLRRPFGDRHEWWSDFFIVLSFFCPQMGPTLVTGISSYLFAEEQSFGSVYEVIKLLLLSSIIHVWSWSLILFSRTFQYYFVKGEYKLDLLYEAIPQKYINNEKDGIFDFTATHQEKSQLTRESDIKADSKKSVLSVRKSAEMGASLIDPMLSVSNRSDRTETALPTTSYVNSSKHVSINQTEVVNTLYPSTLLDDKIRTLTSMKMGHVEEFADSLWSYRDENGTTEPTLQLQTVVLDKFSTETCNMSIFESQSLYVYGDQRSVKNYFFDLAAAQEYPYEGNIVLDNQFVDVCMQVGYVPCDDRLFTLLTGRQTLEEAARFKGYSNPEHVVSRILPILGLENMASKAVQVYSSCEKKMLAFGIAIIDKPSIILLNEIDMFVTPVHLNIIWNIVCHLRTEYHVATVFSTSRACVAEESASHVALLHNGSVLMGDTYFQTRNRYRNVAILTVILRGHMEKQMTDSVLSSSLEGEILPHPHPLKSSIIINIPDGEYTKILSKIRAVTTTLGIKNYTFDTAHLENIYTALSGNDGYI